MFARASMWTNCYIGHEKLQNGTCTKIHNEIDQMFYEICSRSIASKVRSYSYIQYFSNLQDSIGINETFYAITYFRKGNPVNFQLSILKLNLKKFQLIFHTTSMDYEKFHQEYIPKSCLPSNFGGDLESLDEMQKIHTDEFVKLRAYFLNEEVQFQ